MANSSLCLLLDTTVWLEKYLPWRAGHREVLAPLRGNLKTLLSSLEDTESTSPGVSSRRIPHALRSLSLSPTLVQSRREGGIIFLVLDI